MKEMKSNSIQRLVETATNLHIQNKVKGLINSTLIILT